MRFLQSKNREANWYQQKQVEQLVFARASAEGGEEDKSNICAEKQSVLVKR